MFIGSLFHKNPRARVQTRKKLSPRIRETTGNLVKDQKIRFGDIDEIISEDTRNIFLQWIAQANMSSKRTGRTEYGQEYQLIKKEGNCILKCEDGNLKMPDYTLEFKEG